MLARCGAFAACRGDYLLLQALRRGLEAASERPRKVLDAEEVSAVAASWWLAAVAMSGRELEVAAGKPEARSTAAKRHEMNYDIVKIN